MVLQGSKELYLSFKDDELDLLTKTLNVPPPILMMSWQSDITRQNLLLNSVGKDSQRFISATI